MSNPPFPYRTAVVTGASSGVGHALCLALDRLGIERLVLVARRQELLEELATTLRCDTTICCADITKDTGIAAVATHLPEADLLVNNAGVGSFGPFSSAPTEQQVDIVKLNCNAPVHLTSLALPMMVERAHGCVVNIASGMSFQPMPYMSTYAASKAFLLHWAEGVSAELKSTGVRCVTICPGTIHTGFAAASDVPLDALPGVGLVTCSLDSVVDTVLAAIQSNKTVAIPGLGNRMATFSARLFPRALIRWLMAVVLGRAYGAN